MIQDIFPHKLDNHFKPGVKPKPDDILFDFSEEGVLCRYGNAGLEFPNVESCKEPERLTYLFNLDGKRFFLGNNENLKLTESYDYIEVKKLRKKETGQRPLIFAVITARHLNAWYNTNRFCGCCGQKLSPSDTERAMVCSSCGRIFYPRINPAVIVGVTKGEEILLTKYAGRNIPYYALVAGFTEIGESFEETVKREVMEEAGLEVTNIRYYKSQPWGFSGDLLAGYFCDVSGSSDIHMDTSELKEALWMPRKEVPGQPDDFSLTNEMMLAFRDGLI